MTTAIYQETLNSFGAKQYHHQFVYAEDDVKDVQDSYFESLEDCKNAIDALTKGLNTDLRIRFDNGYIVPVFSKLLKDMLSVNCVFIEKGYAQKDLIIFETTHIQGDTVQEIIINAIEKDDFEVR